MNNSLRQKALSSIGLMLAVIATCIMVFFLESVVSMKRGAYESVDSIIVVNQNFRDSGRIIPSYDAAVKYKIIPDQSLKNPFIKKHVRFFFSENSMDTLIDTKDNNVCQGVIARLAKMYKDNDPTDILINGDTLKETIKSQSNIDYACSANDSVSIKNILR